MTVTVGPPLWTDREQWETLYRGYAEFYRVPMTDDILDTVWGWVHDTDNPFFGLVARSADGELLGLMHCRAMPSPLRGVEVGFLDDLFVAEHARGQGVAEALFDALKLLGRAEGWPFVRWITAEDNDRARAVYDRLAEKTHWITYQMSTE